MRAVTHCGTLWTLHRNGQTARAEIVNIEGVGLELRYTRNRKPLVRRTSTDGAELLRDAAIERLNWRRWGGDDLLRHPLSTASCLISELFRA
jgi:hypothetical protein